MIAVYKPETFEYKRLEEAAATLTAASPNGTIYTVEETYFDYGQNWKWTTIIARKPNGSTWQALCPRDHALILNGDIEQAVQNTVNSKFNPDR